MKRIILICGLGLWGCASDVSHSSPSTEYGLRVVRPILDLTPSESTMPSVDLNALAPMLRRSLDDRSLRRLSPPTCAQSLDLWVQPRVLYGVDTVDGRSIPVSHWSAVVELKARKSKLSARVEITSLSRTRRLQVQTVEADVRAGLVLFSKRLEKVLSVLTRPASDLRHVFETGSIAEQKMLLERISLCSEGDFDRQLSKAMTFATDEGVRFRLVGLIGERRLHSAAHQLIDLIDLNNIEWTRSIIRTLSTLDHPRTLELISILAVHESPALQKELKSAVERLERK